MRKIKANLNKLLAATHVRGVRVCEILFHHKKSHNMAKIKKTHCRVSFDGKKWYWATVKELCNGIYTPHRIYMPFGKVLLSAMYNTYGNGYTCKDYQKKQLLTNKKSQL